MSPRAGVVARWAGRRGGDRAVICDGCGEAVKLGQQCPGCRQLARSDTHPPYVAMLAAVIDTTGGPRLVIAQRAPNGGWTPICSTPATGEHIRMIRRAAQLPDTGSGADGVADQLRLLDQLDRGSRW